MSEDLLLEKLTFSDAFQFPTGLQLFNTFPGPTVMSNLPIKQAVS